jgi:hypothetical protein
MDGRDEASSSASVEERKIAPAYDGACQACQTTDAKCVMLGRMRGRSRAPTTVAAAIVAAALMGVVACSPRGAAHGGTSATGEATGDGEGVEKKTIVEKTPDGTRTTVITTTTRKVEAPAPPARPADPFPADPRVKFNVDLLSAYRAKAGLAPLLYDAKISAFALDGSKELAKDHVPHAHFAASAQGAPGFGSRSAENQGDPAGVRAMDADAVTSGKKQIAILLEIMMNEGPGGGHYDNILNPKYRRVGIGLFESAGRLYLTNDFSD